MEQASDLAFLIRHRHDRDLKKVCRSSAAFCFPTAYPGVTAWAKRWTRQAIASKNVEAALFAAGHGYSMRGTVPTRQLRTETRSRGWLQPAVRRYTALYSK